MMKNQLICHLTSVHPAHDNRVFYKECAGLAAAGYRVVLIAKKKDGIEETINGVRIVPFPVIKNRFARILLSPFRMFRLARRQKADLYHFHDPELLITGILLRLFTGAKVVYDIHEDYKTAISQKYYLPRPLALVISVMFGIFENLAARFFHQVLAEKYYSKRFPRGIQVLNYPLMPPGPPETPSPGDAQRGGGVPRLLYTGVITDDRGALLHAGILTHMKNVELHMVGFCRPGIARAMRDVAGENHHRLHLEGEGQFILPTRIREYYATGNWLAGLAIFPPTSHYRLKELTKFFEYMAAGIPIICSDFPVWRELITTSGTGLVVDPFDPTAITNAVRYLQNHPEKAQEMGEKGKQAVQEKFNWKIEEQKLLSLYHSLLTGK